jgi:glutamate N-acetyltransferase/amino-acid N-acetyltransferase
MPRMTKVGGSAPRGEVATHEIRETLEGFALANGFTATAERCGLKESQSLDLAVVVAASPCSAAGVFTTNRVKAAPVLLDQEILARQSRAIRAVVANSGGANACTGPPGLEDARAMAGAAARALGCGADQVLVLSTGVIGRRLDLEKLLPGIARALAPAAVASAAEAARAIVTTDTRPKVAALDLELGGGIVRISGFAKGAGMIHPHLATMLAVITTDARVEPAALDAALRGAADRSFNRVSVDGDMSTNDTLLLLASGASGFEIGPDTRDAFQAALTAVCASLARQIARDGEGATRLVEIEVTGAVTEPEAHAVANAIARSLLVKTAVHGGDPNWGRILAAAGSCGVELDPDRLTLAFGPPSEEVRMVTRGLPAGADPKRAALKLAADPVIIRLDLGRGAAHATVWTCDLSAEYVSINAHYTT